MKRVEVERLIELTITPGTTLYGYGAVERLARFAIATMRVHENLSGTERPICSQCGNTWTTVACGPTHAVVWAALKMREVLLAEWEKS